MTKYKKKPIIIEAFRYGFDEIPNWFKDAVKLQLVTPFSQYGGQNRWCEIETLEGTMRGDLGDYIIQGINGEIYPCKRDIFDKTYEKEIEI